LLIFNLAPKLLLGSVCVSALPSWSLRKRKRKRKRKTIALVIAKEKL